MKVKGYLVSEQLSFPTMLRYHLAEKPLPFFLETGSPSIYIRNKLQEFVQKGPKLYTQMVWNVLSNHQKQLHVYKQMHMIYCFTPYLLFQYHSTCISFFSMHFQMEYNLLGCVYCNLILLVGGWRVWGVAMFSL